MKDEEKLYKIKFKNVSVSSILSYSHSLIYQTSVVLPCVCGGRLPCFLREVCWLPGRSWVILGEVTVISVAKLWLGVRSQNLPSPPGTVERLFHPKKVRFSPELPGISDVLFCSNGVETGFVRPDKPSLPVSPQR